MIARCSPILLLCLVSLASAQFGEAPKPQGDPKVSDKTAQWAKQRDAEHQKQFGKDENYFVRPGILANRKEKWVLLSAGATGMGPNDPIEFFTIPANSGKDYESLSVSYALPSDVHAALEYIGIKPGRTVNYRTHHYWPRGERLAIQFEWDEPGANPGDKPAARKVRAEELILDHRTKKPVPAAGLIFTGSYRFKNEETGKEMYAGDVSDSKSISSTYNEPSSVIDVPYQWVKSEVYGNLKANPAYRFAAGQSVIIRIEPMYRDGQSRLIDLVLKVSMPADKQGLENARYELTGADGKPAADGNTIAHVLAAFGKLTEKGYDPFVTVHVDGGMSLKSVVGFYKVLSELDSASGIRVDAPPAGHLYYRAFFPRQDWRERANRLGRPWELHLSTKDGKLAGQLVLRADEIDDNAGQGDLKFNVASAEELAKTLAEKSDRWSQTVLIFSPEDVKYGAMMDFVRPSLKTHDTMWVFLNP